MESAAVIDALDGEGLFTPLVRALIDHQLLLVVPLVLLEWGIGLWSGRRTHHLRVTAGSIGVALVHYGLYVVVTSLVALPLLGWVRDNAALFQLPSDGAGVWLACLLCMDFCAYWLHRTQHTIRWFWVAHSVHHTAPEFNYTVGPRLGLLDNIDRIPFLVPLAVLGFDAEMIVLSYALIELWSFWTHTRLLPRLQALPWFEWAFNTPANHRLHHGRNRAYLNCNFGEFTMLWDHVFGTYVTRRERILYGADHMPPSHGPWTANVFEMRRLWREMRAASGWRAALAVPCRVMEPARRPGRRRHAAGLRPRPMALSYARDRGPRAPWSG